MKKTMMAGMALAMVVLPGMASAVPYAESQNSITTVIRIGATVHVLAPMAHVMFCARNPAQCTSDGALTVAEDAGTLAILSRVNAEVNASIAPRMKAVDAALGNWEINPVAGDCNDFAVTKKQRLLAEGFPARALLLAHVRTGSGEDHLVLIVRTASADYVLDNLRADVRKAQSTGYRWVRIQSQDDLAMWRSARVTSERTPVMRDMPAPTPPLTSSDIAQLSSPLQLRGSQPALPAFARDIAGFST
ncbi:MAG: transglutaminase-like cysteine peptidase [Beijerinckiaceae bacterium]